jgi:pilus assembly protein CpaB
VLERILVLAVAQEADRDSTKPKVVNAVTLELTPKDAEMLDLARSVGTLSLVLRNQTDPKAWPRAPGARRPSCWACRRPNPSERPLTGRLRCACGRARRRRSHAPAPRATASKSSVGLSKVTECF